MHKRVTSFKNAFKGLFLAIGTQTHLRIHLIATALVLGLAWVFNLSKIEIAILILTITVVIAAELFNTAIEAATDCQKLLKKTAEEDRLIGVAKDVAAGAVLAVALGSIAVGLAIFLPHLA